MSRIRVGVIFGGRSVEHEVSLVSARAVLNHLDRTRYEVVPIGITHAGRWLTSADARGLLDAGLETAQATPAALTGDPTVGGLVPIGNGHGANVALDVVFPLVHGTGGEDGTLQGLLELAGLPYVGSGVLGSSLGMDKGTMKAVFQSAGLACAPWILVSARRVAEDPAGIAREVDAAFGYPCFTKPANGGSSVGVRKVKSPAGLAAGLQEAAQYDRRVVIEQGVEGQEVECAVLGNDAPQASVVGEIVPCHEFYDYSAKYIDQGSELIIPARITAQQAATVQQMSLTAFKALDLAGMARVDFFVRRSDGAVLINEVNTIPGFTPISMYPRLWEASGLAFPALVDRLVQLALERHADRQKARKDFSPGQEAPGTR
ncbi:MAG: D-alanine--D-alanine ligase family protein [Candidatus Polarisedimenticolia bacterium]